MELGEFKARLKSGQLGGCYLFAGEEDYLKKYYMKELKKAVITDEGFAPFNHVVYDGAQIDPELLIDDVKAPPMFEEYKLIEWKFPSFDKMKESELASLEKVVDMVHDCGYAVLSFISAEGDPDLGTAKKPSRFMKRFGEKIGVLSFQRSTDAQLQSWLKKHFDSDGVAVNLETVNALLFRSGHSMSVLASEVDKLVSLAKSRGLSSITPAEVNEVASSTPECDTFALSNAILDRNKKEAFNALAEMKLRRLDPSMIIGMMAKSYSELVTVSMMLKEGMRQGDIETALKINPYKLKLYLKQAKSRFTPERAVRILEELSRTDTSMKYGGITGYTAIELFISRCV